MKIEICSAWYIYIFFLVGGGMEGVGGVGNMNQLYICIYTWRDTGIERDVVRGEGGGWVRYRYSYMGIGIGWNVLSLLEWEMWVSSLYRAWFGNLVGVRGGGERFVFDTSTTTLKTKTKTKDTKEIYKKWYGRYTNEEQSDKYSGLITQKTSTQNRFAWDNFGHLHIDLVFSVFS